MKKLILSSVILILAASSIKADALRDKLQSLGFIETHPPAQDTQEWENARAQRAFIVSNENGISTRLAERSDLTRPKITFKSGEIEYIGTDRGEFGGQLYAKEWISTEPLLSGNIKSLIPIENDLYVFEGMTHMITDEGSVHVIRDYHEPSTPERITLLPTAPAAVLSDTLHNKRVIVIVGQNSFMLLEPDDRLRILYHDTFWKQRFPSSVVRHENYYVFGIRGGVVAVTARFFGRTNIRYFEPER